MDKSDDVTLRALREFLLDEGRGQAKILKKKKEDMSHTKSLEHNDITQKPMTKYLENLPILRN